MKRSSLNVVGAILVLVLALLLPGIAQGGKDQGPSLSSFWLRASNGYLLLALAVHEEDAEVAPDEEDEQGIFLYLVNPRQHTLVLYSTPATVTETTIDADLDELGRISVTRVPTGRTKSVRICHRGPKTQVEVDRYEGTIEFHGEEGFTDVSATSAPLERTPLCFSHDGHERDGKHPDKSLPGARLDVDKYRGRQYRLEFDAVKERPGARTRVSVEVEEQRGEIGIHRATSLLAAPGALRFSHDLHTATVRPPAPFAGHGSFDGDARGAGRWTGNLTVDPTRPLRRARDRPGLYGQPGTPQPSAAADSNPRARRSARIVDAVTRPQLAVGELVGGGAHRRDLIAAAQRGTDRVDRSPRGDRVRLGIVRRAVI